MIDTAGISVIVCCYNSAARLPETLRHLALQDVPASIRWEVIVVDNNSADATSSIAKNAWAGYHIQIPLTVVSEARAGLTYARWKGVECASFEFIVFCDDDNWLQKDYLYHVYETMQAYPNVAVLGGRSDGHLESDKPFWFDMFAHAYVIGEPLAETGIANERKYLTGAGMAVRKEFFQALKQLLFTSVLSDRKKNSLSSGGDSEICMMALYLGYDLYYNAQLQFTHFIPSARLSWKYCLELVSKGFAIPQLYFYFYDYCYRSINDSKKPDFNYAYKRNLRKPFKELIGEVKSIKTTVTTLKALCILQPGSQKQVKVKTSFNKFLFALMNKKELHNAFVEIAALMNRVKTSRMHVSGKEFIQNQL